MRGVQDTFQKITDMNSIPIFKTHASIGKSLLKISDVERIAEENNLEEVFLIEDSMISFPDAFRTFGNKLRFGLRLSIYNEDLTSASKIIAFADGDEGCNELYKLYTESFDKTIVNPWESYKNIQFVVPFYDSFLYNNIFYFTNCMPNLPEGTIFLIEENMLPFDHIVSSKVLDYCERYKMKTVYAKSIFYENRDDIEAFQTYKILCNRKPGRSSCLSRPNLTHFGSKEFCIESWKQKNGRTS